MDLRQTFLSILTVTKGDLGSPSLLSRRITEERNEGHMSNNTIKHMVDGSLTACLQ